MGLMDVVRQKNKECVVDVEEDETKKFCVDCKTTKTPLWRGGPAGPKSLCNACGIRFRKRRMSTIGTNRGCDRKREKTHNHGSTATATTSSSDTAAAADDKSDGVDGEEEEEEEEDEDMGEYRSLRMRLMMAFGKEVVLQQNLPKQPPPRKLGEEEEQAAVSLMALSCGAVFA